jgi:hypothetical protein
MADLRTPKNRDKVIVGKSARVRDGGDVPAYFSEIHRRRLGEVGIVHAVTAAQPRENPLIKVKFGDDAIVFFRLVDLEIIG